MTISPLLGTVDRTAGAVHLQRTLPAPVHEVWDALTDPARLHACTPARLACAGAAGTART